MKLLKNKIVLNSAIILITIAIFSFLFNYLTGQINDLTTQITNQREALGKKIALLNALGTLKSQISQAITGQQKMDSLLPPSDQLLDFPHSLDTLSRVFNISLNFTFQGGQTAPTANTPGFINFQLSISGRLDDVLSFIKNVEILSPRFLINIQKINLSQVSGNAQASVNGLLYFR